MGVMVYGVGVGWVTDFLLHKKFLSPYLFLLHGGSRGAFVWGQHFT